jgi:hypothetical protein
MDWTRVAIIGTAESWQMTPWTDPSLTLVSLNDAYRMKGFQRADVWYDLHPLDHFWSPPEGQPILAHQVPPGVYCRPADHREWLGRQAQTIPVFLHPDYQTQYPDAVNWPRAQAFPKAEIENSFGHYFTSSPAWMMAHAILNGCQELHIYGIHLATEFEYLKQRPNFEYLCGCLLGSGKRTMTVHDGLRRYVSPSGMLVLPESSPVLQESFQYAFDPRPDSGHETLKWDVHRYSVKRERAVDTLRVSPWWQRKAPLQAQLLEASVRLADAQDALQRVQIAQAWR